MTQDERTLRILEDGKWHTTKELMDLTGVWFPPRVIKSLKKKGFPIESARAEFCQKYRLNTSSSNEGSPVVNNVTETPIKPNLERKRYNNTLFNMYNY